MSKLIKNVAKWLGVCVMALVLYAFMFGTSGFFVFASGTTDAGHFDGALAMIANAVERPMAEYYNKYTYLPNQHQMSNLEDSLIAQYGGAVTKIYNP